MNRASKEGLSRFYKDFQRICQQWPVDKSKSGRDFGEHIRKSYDAKFKSGAFQELEAQRTLDALVKISTNYYRNKYPRTKELAYSGENPDAYTDALSTDSQVQVQNKRTFLQKLFGLNKE